MEAILKSNKYHPNYAPASESIYVDSEKLDKSFFNQISYTQSRQSLKEKSYIAPSSIVSKNIVIEINNETTVIPIELKHIATQIEEAKEILQYTFDWDDEGALATDDVTFGNAASFVKDYALYLYQMHSVVLAPPYIDILKDGSVSVHWERPNAQFLIVFKKNNSDLAYYFAKHKENKVPFKSAIELGKPVDEFLALWMKKNLI